MIEFVYTDCDTSFKRGEGESKEEQERPVPASRVGM